MPTIFTNNMAAVGLNVLTGNLRCLRASFCVLLLYYNQNYCNCVYECVTIRIQNVEKIETVDVIC